MAESFVAFFGGNAVDFLGREQCVVAFVVKCTGALLFAFLFEIVLVLSIALPVALSAATIELEATPVILLNSRQYDKGRRLK